VAFVISRDSLTALEPRNVNGAYYQPAPRSIAVSPAMRFTYGHIYRAQPAVRTVVSFLARNVAQLGLHTFERLDDGDRRRIRDTPLARLFDINPNPTTTPYRLIFGMMADRAIYDVAFWLKVRGEDRIGGGRGPVLGLRRVSPRRLQPLDGDWLDVDRFRLHGRNGYLDVDRQDLVIFPGYDPEDESASGASPIEALRLVLAEEWAAAQYREQLWRNGARTSGYIKRPASAPEWSGPARKRFREEWQAQYAGDGPNAGGTPILEDDMEWLPAGVSPRDAQYIESRKLTREEVAAEYHIPPPFVGLLDNATFSNITEQHKQLYQDTLGPWTVGAEEEIVLQLVSEFADPSTTYVEFNYAEKLRGSFEEQAEGLQSAVGRPYLTPNEARARLNLPGVDGGDELLVPLNMGNAGGDPNGSPDELKPDPSGPADPAADPASDPATDPAAGSSGGKVYRFGGKSSRSAATKQQPGASHLDEHERLMSATFERQQRSVLARAGAKSRGGRKATAAELFDRERWDRELAADLNSLAGAVVGEVAGDALTALGSTVGFDPSQVVNVLDAETTRVAASVNATTEQQIAVAVEQADGDESALPELLAAVFVLALSKRVVDIARTQITNLAGFGTVEAARQTALRNPGSTVTKKWITGPNPRPTHAAMDGNTVAYDQPFSNGAHWPADAAHLDVDEVAGCNCDVEIEFHDDSTE
jgi:HK97 family phage portal protein